MTSYPIETQAAVAITAGLCAWLIGALMREIAGRPLEAWVGRIVVGVGVLQLAAFANFAAGQVEFLQFVQRGERANESGSRIIEWTTDGGHPFRFDAGSGRSTTGIGYTSAVLPTMGRTPGGESGRRRCDCSVGGACDCDAELCARPQSRGSAVATSSARRRVCECEQCACEPCICRELQAAAN